MAGTEMYTRTHFARMLLIQPDGQAELIDGRAIADTSDSDGTYRGVGLPGLEEFQKILRRQGKLKLMNGFRYPQDVFREITVEELRNAQVYLQIGYHIDAENTMIPLTKLNIVSFMERELPAPPEIDYSKIEM